MSIDKYVGRMIMIVYVDKKDRFSKRTIRVMKIKGRMVLAFDLARNEPRQFETERILAAEPVSSRGR